LTGDLTEVLRLLTGARFAPYGAISGNAAENDTRSGLLAKKKTMGTAKESGPFA
jgi:hypothetical protein